MKHSMSASLTYNNGQQGSELTLGEAKLPMGTYKVRLLILDAPFPGKNKIYETSIDFEVGEERVQAKEKEIRLGYRSAKNNYFFLLSKKLRVTDVNLIPSTAHDDISIEKLLASKSFIRVFGTSKRCFDFSDQGGQVDKLLVNKVLSRRRLFLCRIFRVFKRSKVLHL
jgi:hypothetical protein